MRLILIFSALLSGVSAYACPDLSGSYTKCSSGMGLRIDQVVKDGNTIYVMRQRDPNDGTNYEDYISADGLTSTYSEVSSEEYSVDISSKYSCSGNELVNDVVATVREGDEVKELKSQSKMRKEGNKFIFTQSGIIDIVDGGRFVLLDRVDEIICE